MSGGLHVIKIDIWPVERQVLKDDIRCVMGESHTSNVDDSCLNKYSLLPYLSVKPS